MLDDNYRCNIALPKSTIGFMQMMAPIIRAGRKNAAYCATVLRCRLGTGVEI